MVKRGTSREPPARYKLHWHVFLTHFPLSLIGVAFLFQLLHLFAYPRCFELAGNVVLVAGVASLVPTTWTGYHTWKRSYNGVRVDIFRRKITIAAALLLIGVPLAIWRITAVGFSPEVAHGSIHWLYFSGNVAMIAGTLLEGYYGGQLNHR